MSPLSEDDYRNEEDSFKEIDEILDRVVREDSNAQLRLDLITATLAFIIAFIFTIILLFMVSAPWWGSIKTVQSTIE